MLQDQQLAAAVANCTACRLGLNPQTGLPDRGGLSVPAMPGTNYVKGGLALFLEAPGGDEELLFTILLSGEPIGKPLIGKAGQLCNVLLFNAGINREDILVLNSIRCRPPRNRIDDYPDAVSQCDPWVQKELALYEPAVVVLCGNTALKAVYGATASITATRGKPRTTSSVFPYGNRTFISTFHPSYALRNGGATSSIAQDIINDFKLAKNLLNG